MGTNFLVLQQYSEQGQPSDSNGKILVEMMKNLLPYNC